MPPINTEVPPDKVGNGRFENVVPADRFNPKIAITVPGANGAPPCGYRLFTVPLVETIGTALFGVTAPANCCDVAWRPGAFAVALTPTSPPAFCGIQFP